jgi:hypothetical protein
MKKIKNHNIDFSKIVHFTDLHLGLRNNSREHNSACENFIKWMISESKIKKITTCLFSGDFHHVRSAINISTLNYSVSCLRLLSENFDNVVMIPGNHDLWYRDKREINSLPYVEEFKNIHFLNEITTIDDFAFVPWLTGDEWKEVAKIKQPWMFGHFELPSFMMNAQISMPDHGQLSQKHFEHQKMVFSGHFHKRQNQGKIWYTGNCFPHNYSDAWDDNRGIMFWTPGQEPEFISWPDAPSYRTMSLSQVLSNPSYFINNKTYARIAIDLDLTYEEITFLKTQFETELGAKEIHMQNNKNNEDIIFDGNIAIGFESVDHIVISHLQTIESNSINTQKLIEIYSGL